MMISASMQLTILTQNTNFFYIRINLDYILIDVQWGNRILHVLSLLWYTSSYRMLEHTIIPYN